MEASLRSGRLTQVNVQLESAVRRVVLPAWLRAGSAEPRELNPNRPEDERPG